MITGSAKPTQLLLIGIGEKEELNNTVSVRRRFDGDLGHMSLDDLITSLTIEINNRRIAHSEKEEAATE